MIKFTAQIVHTRVASPLGELSLAASPDALVGLWLPGQRHAPDISSWPYAEAHPVLQQAKQQLLDYFAGHRRDFDLPLWLQGGTAFQQSVWLALREIPAGQTWTYLDLARRIGRPSAVRAVGAAVGRNPLSIIVPCHRVLGKDGSLTGYAGGLTAKRRLLALEADPSARVARPLVMATAGIS